MFLPAVYMYIVLVVTLQFFDSFFDLNYNIIMIVSLQLEKNGIGETIL